MTLQELLEKSIEQGASDIHVVTGQSPIFRINTELVDSGFPVVTDEIVSVLVREMLGDRRYAQFLRRRDFDFSTFVKDRARFRVNAHFQRDTIGIAFRAIPNKVPPLGDLNLPPVVSGFTDLPRGLVLVTGETGSGKSTTLAAMIQEINYRHALHVITLEDPVEYTLRHNKCLIEQRELGSDVTSFAAGLRHVLRQDPDVIMVGEMRDLETTSAAITAAETGHLVLSTLHTQSASQTVERIIDIYPSDQQNQIRAMLANTLQAVISQTLLKRSDRKGMIPATEVLVCNSAARACIRENRIFEIPNIIQTNSAMGMITLDQSLKRLFLNGCISRDVCLTHAKTKDLLNAAISA
ncbi:MAG: type IV pilus twitching motility protein PilT [Planctomycetota bacterium]|nr:type IV pilus twitching motility protein PilT [Planctomycetota bacterium]